MYANEHLTSSEMAWIGAHNAAPPVAAIAEIATPYNTHRERDTHWWAWVCVAM